jgi:hypothetical protein
METSEFEMNLYGDRSKILSRFDEKFAVFHALLTTSWEMRKRCEYHPRGEKNELLVG